VKKKIYFVDKEERNEVFALTIPGFISMLNKRLTSRNSDKHIRKMYPMRVLYFGVAWKFFTTKIEAENFLIKK